MNIEKILSGHELAAKGCTKVEITLPEIGYKESLSNGSWLEQKQVQASIEARKHLIEVQRIEKCGALSHAEWREDLMLAEVTQKVGSCWQVLGHNKGKHLFLEPEEALFLMEVNCLHLKYNGVKVSIQQAYSLLLRGKIQILQYKVYASLSRLGYRIYRHENTELPHKSKTNSTANNKINNNEGKINNDTVLAQEEQSVDNNKFDMEKKYMKDASVPESLSNTKKRAKSSYEINRLQKLKNRTLKPCNEKNIHKFFENFPELVNKQIVFIKAPNNNHIPKSINLKKIVYSINMQNIQAKNVRSVSMDTNIYSLNDEVNGSHIRRIRNSSSSSTTSWNSPCTSFGFANQNIQYRQFNFRARQQYNHFNFSMLFQKHFVPNWFLTPRFQFLPPNGWENFDIRNKNFNKIVRKRPRKTLKTKHFEEIRKLAWRLKQLILSGNTEEHNTRSLQNLIQAYNKRYKTRLRLNTEFDIIVDDCILDIIEVEDDDGPSVKRRRNESTDNRFDDNFNMLKKLATQLKELEKNNKSSARHRRAFSKVLRTFNESYNEEYYLSERYEIEYREHVDLATSDSSSAEDNFDDTRKFKKGKKLRNPFNILKKLSERQNDPNTEASTSNNVSFSDVEYKKYSQLLLKTFTKNWLPPEDDFGKAEIVSKKTVKTELIDMKREQFLFDFLQLQTCNCNNWLDLKKAFFNSIKKATMEFENSTPAVTKSGMNPIVKPNDCTELKPTLQKLRIIQAANEFNKACNLTIDFDVFDRGIRNFKKTKRPTPNFRIICIDEKLEMLRGEDIASVHSKYDDNVVIVFAIVGVESIIYLQINPNDLPVYISNNT